MDINNVADTNTCGETKMGDFEETKQRISFNKLLSEDKKAQD